MKSKSLLLLVGLVFAATVRKKPWLDCIAHSAIHHYDTSRRCGCASIRSWACGSDPPSPFF